MYWLYNEVEVSIGYTTTEGHRPKVVYTIGTDIKL